MKKRSAQKKGAKVVRRSSRSSGSALSRLLDKKHRPLHGAALGTVLVLLKGLLAVLGVVILLVAAFAYILRASKATR